MIFLPLFILVFILNYSHRVDPDLGWHLLLGKIFTQSGHLIQKLDGYSVFSGIKLPDHEWLADYLLYKGYVTIGYPILLFFSALVLFLIVYLLFRCFKNSNKTISEISLLLLLFPLSISFGVRVQIILLLAVALLLFAYQNIQKRSLRFLIYLLLFTIGGNLHGGFLVLIIIPILFEFNFNNIIKSLKYELILIPLLLIALSINPYGIEYWKLAYGYAGNTYYTTHIAEWRSFLDFPFLIFELILPLSLYLFVLTFNQNWKRIPKNELLLYLLFLYLGLRYIRFFPIFALLITPQFDKALNQILRTFKARSITNLTHPIYLLVLIFIGIITFQQPPSFKAYNAPFQETELDNSLKNITELNPKEGNFLNPYNQGGYIAWTHQEFKIFIDGRGPQVNVSPDSTLLEEYNKFFSDPKTIENQLSKYDIGYILIEISKNNFDSINNYLYKLATGHPFQPQNKLDNYLKGNPQWQKTFESSSFKVYKKN